MRKFKYLPLALAALMLGACSNEDVVDPGRGTGGVGEGEKGYLSVAINLPTQPSTRAEDNSATLDDGDDVEYNVVDATLLLFTGTTEAGATFYDAYDLTGTPVEDVDGDHVTTSYTMVRQVTKPTLTGSQKLYGLVVLNNSGLLDKEGDTWTLKDVAITTSTTYSAFNQVLQLNVSQIANRFGNGNFLMLNAPLYTKAGGTQDPTEAKPGSGETPASPAGTLQTLAEVDMDKIVTDQTMAERNPAVTVYVERAVAKVTVTADGVTSDLPAGFTATPQGWVLDQTNINSYLVRNMEGADWWGFKAEESKTYRFVGNTPLETGISLYRTYWGVDPNYTGTNSAGKPYVDGSGNVLSTQTEFTSLAGTAPTDLTGFGSNNPLYCLENTFDVDNMRKDQTTRAIVGVKLSVANAETNGDFYVINNNVAQDLIYGHDDLITLIKKAYLEAVDATLHGENGLDLQGSEKFGEDDIAVTFKKGDATTSEDEMGGLPGGTVTVSDIHVKSTSNEKFKNDVIPASLASNDATVTGAINSSNVISYYKGGIAYYPVLIEHFNNDSETPWDTGDVQNADSYPGTGTIPAQNWLGRYGVLRNNWYEIQITGIYNIGTAEIVPETGYDDPPSYYMSARINVLSWAKRKQSVDL